MSAEILRHPKTREQNGHEIHLFQIVENKNISKFKLVISSKFVNAFVNFCRNCMSYCTCTFLHCHSFVSLMFWWENTLIYSYKTVKRVDILIKENMH